MLNAERANLQRAFLFACGSGHDDVVEFLLENGADLRDQAGTREALLHWAVMGGRVSTIELLIEHGASREERNGYGGTPLGLALWSFMHDPTIDHVPTIEALLAAGGELVSRSLASLEPRDHGGDAAVQEKCDCIEHMEIAVEKRTNGEPKRDAYGIHRICRTT